jgi:hypothetical protein
MILSSMRRQFKLLASIDRGNTTAAESSRDHNAPRSLTLQLKLGSCNKCGGHIQRRAPTSSSSTATLRNSCLRSLSTKDACCSSTMRLRQFQTFNIRS